VKYIRARLRFLCPDCGLPFELLKDYLKHLSYLNPLEQGGRLTAAGKPEFESPEVRVR
jgi:uncharacterized C2H2 Zn-finger protein